MTTYRKINDRNYMTNVSSRNYQGAIYPYVEQVLPVYGGGGGFGMTGTQPMAGSGFVTSSGYGARDIGDVRQNIRQKAVDYSAQRYNADQQALNEYMKMMQRLGMTPDKAVVNQYLGRMTQPSTGKLTFGGGATTIKQGKLNKAMEEAKTLESQKYIVENKPGGISDKLKELKAADIENRIASRNKQAEKAKVMADAASMRAKIAEKTLSLKEKGFEYKKLIDAKKQQKTLQDELAVTNLFEMASNAQPEEKAELTKYIDEVLKGMPAQDAYEAVQANIEQRNNVESIRNERAEDVENFRRLMAENKNEQAILDKIQSLNEDVTLFSSSLWMNSNKISPEQQKNLIRDTNTYISILKGMLDDKYKSGQNNIFNSEEEAMAAKPAIGSTIYINGKKAIVE